MSQTLLDNNICNFVCNYQKFYIFELQYKYNIIQYNLLTCHMVLRFRDMENTPASCYLKALSNRYVLSAF